MEQKKNIVIIGSAYPLRGGGISSFNERLAKALQDNGHTVNIYSFSLQYPSFLFPGTSQYSTALPPQGLNIYEAINSVNPANWIKVGNRIRKEQPDIVVVRYWIPFMGPCLGTILRIIKKNRHSKIVCIADNVIPHETKFYDNFFTRYFIKPVDAFITMSEKVLADLKRFTSTKPARYVPHPLYDNFGAKIDKRAARENLGLDKEALIMLFFGFIRKYKGLDILLEAMHLLRNENPPVKLLIAGEYYEGEKSYVDQIDRLGIRDMLILKTNFIADDEIKNYLCAADVVVQPYRNATQSGVTPLAYHFEIPMIVTNVGGLPSLVPDNVVGLVAEPNAESLAQKIREYFHKGASHFLPGLIEEKKKYSWDVMVEEILGIDHSK